MLANRERSALCAGAAVAHRPIRIVARVIGGAASAALRGRRIRTVARQGRGCTLLCRGRCDGPLAVHLTSSLRPAVDPRIAAPGAMRGDRQAGCASRWRASIARSRRCGRTGPAGATGSPCARTSRAGACASGTRGRSKDALAVHADGRCTHVATALRTVAAVATFAGGEPAASTGVRSTARRARSTGASCAARHTGRSGVDRPARL